MLVSGPVSLVGLAIVGAIAAFLYSLRLRTEVRADGIHVQMWHLHRSFRHIPWADIESVESRRYRPIREFGGWGIRWTPSALAYNVHGNEGLWIRRTTG
ncbi:hypothetical protein [Haloarchaeobius sp. TZWWS8]|uniref:hypothetical protein n=1 Tax=Haloarchaeobius sp. TZWWS8 TaxID=3446121 RepID=UPI003EC151E6